VNGPRRQAVGDQIQESSPISRRRFFRLSSAAVGGLSLVELLGGCSSAARRPARARGPQLELAQFGAHGNGRSDDTNAFRRALGAARPGTTIYGRPDAVYVLNGTVSFPRDNVTLDLRGGAVRTGPARVGPAVTSDTLFELTGRHGVRITHGRILTSLSPFLGTDVRAKIIIVRGASCVVSNLHATCAGSSLVEIGGGSDHRVDSNYIQGGYVSGFSCQNVVVSGNVIVGSPFNALGFAGYSHAPCVGNQYLHNAIWDHGRIAIEEHSPDDPRYNAGAVIRGNHIGRPAVHTTSGTAISAVGTDGLVEANVIEEATGYAIEASGFGTHVIGNQIGWATRSATNPPAIAVNSSMPGGSPALVKANSIHNPTTGIVLYANPLLSGVTVSDNEIVDAALTAIDLSSPTGAVEQASCIQNAASFASAPLAGVRRRVGIKTTAGARISDNRVMYARRAASSAADTPIEFVGAGVSLVANVVNGGRATQPVVSRSVGLPWSGWLLEKNQFVDGAVADVIGLTAPALRANVGVIRG
jgi:hypothetical protein